ncbi:RagB/SusD family nutrient uptake outer membrane protein [Chitinophaga polysaccharea]|uniref:RagB/SusD family nutrient uptake outer membrane protein n=1 Tax=Chitinophaga TaxID=79328 RepID=UPI0014552FB3|nr:MULTISPECIES: RagB/SusD family nutrient uptake outer membrane protein [Chitinophaga]NLR57376.1 RagB/SusD family nutrient uptake outer membrane protein [Chitinophaga polysaccharea]NLU92528.1 RagB/SusD family nutrient uptake outer membrane protein [Chitinophaga sp. Ak27]
MKKTLIVAQIALLLGVSGCTDKLLNLKPDDTLTTGNFYKTSNDMNQAALGIYNSLQQRKQNDYLIMEVPSDNLYMSNNTSVAGANDMDYLTVNQDNNIVGDFWEATYVGIGRANALLQNIDNPKDYAAGMKDQYTGEAKFMRALFYFDLVRLFGGVPKVIATLSIADARNMPRAAASDIYDLIVSDLKDAADKLPAPSAIAKGRASKAAALGMLGKVYVYRKDYANAKACFEKLNSDYTYQLEPSFATLWSLATEDNREVIFSMKYIENSAGQTLSTAYTPNGGLFGLVDRGNEIALPSWSLDKLYVTGDTRKANTISDMYVPATGGSAIWYPYVNKYAVKHSVGSSGLDLPVLRFGDVVLLYAETLYNLGDKANALIQLNKVRERAFGDNSHDYTATDIASADAFLDKLLLERQLELAYENERWMDLVRTGRFITVMTKEERLYNNVTNQPLTAILTPKSYMALFPIPKRQIDLYTPGVLKQNDGY